MRVIVDILWWIALVYIWIVVARIVIGWLPIRWPKPLRPLVVLVYDLTEPILSPLRRWMPVIPISSGVGLDLSPMMVIVAVLFLQWLIRRLFG